MTPSQRRLSRASERRKSRQTEVYCRYAVGVASRLRYNEATVLYAMDKGEGIIIRLKVK